MTAATDVVVARLRRRPQLRSRAARRVVRNGAVVFASTLAWHASNFLFNGATARLLGPARYGELAATIALLYVVSPVLVSVQTMTCAAAAELTVQGRAGDLRPMLAAERRRIGLAALVVAGTTAVASVVVAPFLRLGSPLPIAILGVGLGLSLVTHCQRGVLQGTEVFGRYAVSTLVEASTKILAAVVVLLVVSRTATGAAVAIPLSAAFGLAANARLLRFLPRGGGSAEDRPRPQGRPAATVATFVLLALLLAADVVAAKRYLPGQAAGVYAAVSLSGKAVYFATSALSLILFPVFASHRARNVSERRPLVIGTVLIALASAGMAAVYVGRPGDVVHLLYGSRYDAAAPFLGWIALAFGSYALVYLFATFLLARRSRVGVAVLGCAAAAQVSALSVAHGSVGSIVAVQVVVLSTTAVALGVASYASGGRA